MQAGGMQTEPDACGGAPRLAAGATDREAYRRFLVRSPQLAARLQYDGARASRREKAPRTARISQMRPTTKSPPTGNGHRGGGGGDDWAFGRRFDSASRPDAHGQLS
uniref:Uncharacterized protein n=1 Tax=Plectus sambesii TaxID=2011161 RepID=A0A914X4F8_9BILA